MGFWDRSWGRRFRRRVVFPDPRKPVTMVIGMGDIVLMGWL